MLLWPFFSQAHVYFSRSFALQHCPVYYCFVLFVFRKAYMSKHGTESTGMLVTANSSATKVYRLLLSCLFSDWAAVGASTVSHRNGPKSV